MGEVESTLKWFKKDKSLGLDGFSVEFYTTFFDAIGQELLKIVEDYRLSGCMYEAINSTFIALIPKVDSPLSFNDFRPISICNFLYKIISNRLKPILSNHISPEQFAFLHNRQILEVVGTSQEALHSIKMKQLKGAIPKIDLSEAFDRVSWLYIRMLLTHLGFSLSFINWIMCYITTVSFSVLINDSTSNFFHLEYNLRQGFPLSPLLFLLVMEGLSRIIL